MRRFEDFTHAKVSLSTAATLMQKSLQGLSQSLVYKDLQAFPKFTSAVCAGRWQGAIPVSKDITCRALYVDLKTHG
jgi:hypothetical protein